MASEAPRTLFCWPGLTSNLLGSGTLNPGGGLNSGAGGSGAEVEAEAAVVSGWAALTASEAALAARAVAVAVARRGRRRGVRWCSAVGAAGGAMDGLDGDGDPGPYGVGVFVAPTRRDAVTKRLVYLLHCWSAAAPGFCQRSG